jgi:predicted ATP-dependent serine protease
LLLVSHVNDEGKTRGSRNISKIADCWIHLHRNQQAETEEQRNTTYLEFRKNRFGARTGPADQVYFDISTFKVEDTQPTFLPPVE